jgi:hypothetical protein
VSAAVIARAQDPRGSARRSPTAGNRGQGGKWLHPTTRRRIYERDGWRCVWCCAQVERNAVGIVRQATIDHVIPRSRGGSNRASNLITCCSLCNAKRGHRSVPAFAVALCGVSDQVPPVLVGYLRHLEPIKMIVRRVRAAQRRKLPTIPEPIK